MEEYKKYWSNFVNFSGRATRKEFWIPVLFNFVISAVLTTISSKLGYIFDTIIIIPALSCAVRRLHDINKSGWNILLAIIPFVGWIILLVFYCSASVDSGNNYPVN